MWKKTRGNQLAAKNRTSGPPLNPTRIGLKSDTIQLSSSLFVNSPVSKRLYKWQIKRPAGAHSLWVGINGSSTYARGRQERQE